MTSLGFSDYNDSNNENNRNDNNGKIYNRRNGAANGGGGNRTLKIPRNNNATPERGLLQSPNGAISGITNENGTNDGVIQNAGKKIRQIKDYIENIHRKGGEDSDEDGGDDILPSYPAQGMGVYATNVSQTGIIRGVSSNTSSSSMPGSDAVVRKTTQINSLNPGSSYSSTLLEGMNSAANAPSSPYFEKLTGIASTPKKDAISTANTRTSIQQKGEPPTSSYASQYYEQFVPYAETLANNLASGNGSYGSSGTNAALIEKLNYIIHMLEEKKNEKTGHVVEELVLYCFLGVFIIFVVDTFARTSSASSGRGGGGGGGGFSMFGGAARRSQTTSVYRR
jgi:hypothetical protein